MILIPIYIHISLSLFKGEGDFIPFGFQPFLSFDWIAILLSFLRGSVSDPPWIPMLFSTRMIRSIWVLKGTIHSIWIWSPISSSKEDDLKKKLYIYNIVMSFIEEISWMSKSGYSDRELLEYIDKHFDEIECELNEEVYKEPKKHDHNFCIKCKLRKTIDYQNRL